MSHMKASFLFDTTETPADIAINKLVDLKDILLEDVLVIKAPLQTTEVSQPVPHQINLRLNNHL